MNNHYLKSLLLGLFLSFFHSQALCLEQTMLHILKHRSIILEIANDEPSRLKGLMFRESIDAHHGMLFQFEKACFCAIWMKNMNFPIDIIWLNQDNKVVDWVDNVQPCPKEVLNCPLYKSRYPAFQVIELKAGQRKKLHIQLSQTLKY